MAMSNDLMMAILAMDSYNRGYGAGLDLLAADVSNSQIGKADILSVPAGFDMASAQASGFYAASYTLNGQTVISYRGTNTDSLTSGGADVLMGWITGTGAVGPQAYFAEQFYSAVTGKSINAGPSANTILTGHSLGGGLAGYLSALTGTKGVGFDHMPFGLAAWLRHHLDPARTVEQAPIFSQFDGINVTDEVLQFLRDGSIPLALSAIFVANPWLLALGVTEAAAITYFESLNRSQTGLDSFGGVRSPIDLHSMPLQVVLQFARDEMSASRLSGDWQKIAPQLWDAFFNGSVAAAARAAAPALSGTSTSAAMLQSAVAYSAIDEGTRVFGDTGMRAMFNDANELGRLVSLADASTTLKNSVGALSEVLMQFAGLMAFRKVLQGSNPAAVHGVFQVPTDNSTLSIDLGAATWNIGALSGSSMPEIIGAKTLTDTVLKIPGITLGQAFGIDPLFNDIRSGMRWLWNDETSAVIDRITFAAKNTAQTLTIANRPAASDKASLFAGADLNDSVTGSKDRDFIFGGLGNDTLRGMAGDDLLAGGDGNDILIGGEGRDFLAGGRGVDIARYELPVVNLDIAVVSAVAGVNDQAVELKRTATDVDRLFAVERVELTAGADRLRPVGVLEQLVGDMTVTFDGRSQPLGARTDAKLGDVLDLSQQPGGVYIAPAKGNTTSVEIYKQGFLSSLTSFFDTPTGLRFTNFEHVIGSSAKDIMDLGQMYPGGAPTAAEQAAITTAFNTYNANASNRASSEVALRQLISDLGALRPYQEKLLVEGGGGNDVITGAKTGIVTLQGGDGIDRLYAHDAGYATFVYGGAGSDLVAGGGLESHLWGGDGVTTDNTSDIFMVTAGTFVMDATKDDFVTWGTDFFRVTGGVQQWWTEGDWAYWTPFTSMMSPLSLYVGGGILATLSLIDVTTALTFRFGQTETNQLIIEFGRGRGGRAVIENYDLELDTGEATGGIVAFRQVTGTGSVQQFKQYLNLALQAGFGQGLPEVDPLVLDLDGDGIELTGETTAYFDMNGDGFRERSFWVKGGDGFLVRDLNGNGVIDNITEMFGNAVTPGFTALKALDTNNDNRITATDSSFGALRVWVDTDGDGITDAGELKTLSSLGITAISTNGATPLAENASIRGNEVRAETTFTMTGGVTRKIADVLLQSNTIDTIWTGDKTVSAAAAALPNLKGFGTNVDLRVAMTDVPALLALVDTFSKMAATSTWAQIRAAADDILFRWAGVQAVTATAINGSTLDARELAFLEKHFGTSLVMRDGQGNVISDNLAELSQTFEDVLDTMALRLALQGPFKTSFPNITYDGATDELNATTATALPDAIRLALTKLSVTAATALTQWNTNYGPMFQTLAETLLRADGNTVKPDFLVASLVRAMDGLTQPLTLRQIVDGMKVENVILGTSGANNLSRANAGDIGFDELAIFVADAGNDTLDGSGGQSTYIFGRGFGSDTIIDTEAMMEGDRIRFALLSSDQVTLSRAGLDLVITVNGTSDRITVKDQFTSYLTAGNSGIEEIQFADGTLLELADILAAVGRGTNAAETIAGTELNDEIEGLKGNDILRGGDGGDIYVFGRGDGQDVIEDIQTTFIKQSADSVLILDSYRFDDMILSRYGASDDLVITFKGTTDKITIKDQFDVSPLGISGGEQVEGWIGGLINSNPFLAGSRIALDSRIEGVFFASGGALSWKDIQQRLIAQASTDANDTIYGFGTADTFLSSKGNDLMIGGNGSDTYHFGRGSGQDVIHDRMTYITIQGTDRVQFGAGITAADIIFSRPTVDPDLVISIRGTTDTLTVKGQFDGFAPDLFGLLPITWFDRIEEFVFADGSVVTAADVLTIVTTGSTGNDLLIGDYTPDMLDGKAGADFMDGRDGGDIYLFGRGDGQDTIHDQPTYVIDTTPDTLRFKSGIAVNQVTFSRDGETFDLLASINGTSDVARIKDQYDVTETLVFGAIGISEIERFEWADGTVKTWATLSQEIITKARTTGNDLILGTHYNDRLDGGAGADTLKGGNGSDTYVFGRGYGADVIEDNWSNILSANSDTVLFGANIAPTQLTFARAGTDLHDLVITITGTTDTVTISGQFDYSTINYRPFEIERFQFANGTVWSAADMRVQYITSRQTAGNDIIDGFWSADIIEGGAGNDILRGGDGNDTYRFAAGFGTDIIEESQPVATYSDDDTVEFGAGLTATAARLARSNGDLIVTFAGLTDRLTMKGQFLHVGAGSSLTDVETFRFADGTVWTDTFIRERLIAQSATTGNNTITGFGGADVIDGLAGNDTLRGLGGGDTYLFGRGSGADIIQESLGSYWGDLGHVWQDTPDTVRFGADIARSDVTFARVGNDLRASINGTSDTLTIRNHFTDAYARIELFSFANGSVMTAAQAEANAIAFQSTSGNDTIIGGAGRDTLDGGAGNDYLRGEGGGDTYVFGRGYGSDRIEDTLGIGTPNDRVSFKSGISPADLTWTRSVNDLVITIAGTTDRLTILGQFDRTDGNDIYGYRRIESFAFANGTVLSGADVDAMILRNLKTAGNDIITGYERGETLDGGAGNDRLVGAYGGDTYIFARGYGQDTIEDIVDGNSGTTGDRVKFGDGIQGSDLVFARSGANLVITIKGTTDRLTILGQFDRTDGNQLYGNRRIEHFELANGAKWTAAEVDLVVLRGQQTAGNDTVTGYEQGDTLDGGAGNDRLVGANGDDTYVFGRGYGRDTIEDIVDGSSGSAGDRASFKSGVAPADLVLSRSGFDLVIGIAGTTDQLTILGQFDRTDGNQLYGNRRIETFHFADGTIWTAAEMDLRALAAHQTSGNDTIVGFDGTDIIDPLAGDDLMMGGDGDDIYVFGRGYGRDTIEETTGIGNSGDRVAFAAGITPADLVLSRSGNDLVIAIIGTNDSLTVRGQFDRTDGNQVWGYLRVEHFAFRDGTIWSAADVDLRVLQANQTAGDDVIIGYDGADTIDGRDGHDTINGHNGDDMIRGAAGNDVIDGGEGNDWIDAGAGSDTVFGGSGNDTLVLSVSDVGDFDVIDGYGGTDTLDLSGFRSAVAVTLSALTSGTVATSDTATIGTATRAMADLYGVENITGTTFADRLTGDNFANRIDGGAGNDILDGGSGNDTLIGGTGNDRLIGNVGRDFLTGGAGNDTFVFALPTHSTVGANADTISDFTIGADRIDLSAIDANAGLAGNQAFNFIGAAAFSNIAGQLRSEIVTGFTNVYGDTNGDGIADFQIRLTGTHTLDTLSFLL